MKYRAEIDGLRAVAIIPVIFYHAGFNFFNGGYVGVDVFFVISGYLITNVIIVEKSEDRFSLLNFYERRVRRILPALFFITLTCIPFAWLWLMPVDMKNFSQSVAAVATFSSNLLFLRESGYFDAAVELKPLIHTWSLAIEEQYYLLFPLFVILLWRSGKRGLLVISSLLLLLSLSLSQLIVSTQPAAAFYLLPTRAWELLIGVVVALSLFQRRKERVNIAICQAGSLIGAVLIAYSVFTYDTNTPFPSVYTLAPTVGTALIIVFAVKGTIVKAWLSNKTLVGLGLISYSLYLWHQPLFAFTRYRSFSEPTELMMASLCVATLPLAFLSWRYVEKPFRTKGLLHRNVVFGLATVCILFFGMIGYMGHSSDGFTQRVKRNPMAVDGDLDHFAFLGYIDDQFVDCTPTKIATEALTWRGIRRCAQSSTGEQVDVVLIGDSHAEHLFIGLSEALPKHNIAYYIQAAVPVLGSEQFETIFSHVIEDKYIQVVVLTMSYGRPLREYGPINQLQMELERTIENLVNSGKRVVVVGDIPLFEFEPTRCAYVLNSDQRIRCDMDEAIVSEYQTPYAGILRSISSVPGAEFVDLNDLFCYKSVCSMRKGTTLMYRDNNHLNIPGSRFVGAELLKRSTYLRLP